MTVYIFPFASGQHCERTALENDCFDDMKEAYNCVCI